jgi:tetratricopeptide (TPR) repeat protein
MRKRALIITLASALLLVWGTLYAQTNNEYAEALKYYETGNYSEAIKYLKDYVEKKPEPSAYYLIGYALYKLGRNSEAAEYFKQAYFIDPNFSPQQMEYFKKKPREETKEIEKLSGKSQGMETPSQEPAVMGAPAEERAPEEETPSAAPSIPQSGAGEESTPAQPEPQKEVSPSQETVQPRQ